MNKKDFSASLKAKTVSALLDLLKQGQSGKSGIDPDFLGLVIDELNSRQLSDAETKEFENLMESSFDEVVSETVKSQTEFSKDEIRDISKDKDREPGKYTALKTVVGFISLLGYIVIIIGIGALIYLSSEGGSVLMGFVALVVSVVIALPLLAYSNLIYVFIDIEYNTRKTREALKKK